VSQATLKALIAKTAHAMSMEETRFILNGALLTTQKNQLVIVTTDGRRLAVAEGELNAHTKSSHQAIIPAKTVRELGRLLQDDEEDVTVTPLKDTQLTFQFGGVTVITRLIEGQFPAYEKVIPPPSKSTFSCDRQGLIGALRRAGLMTTASSQAVIFELSANRLVVSKESHELGSAREELLATYTGEPLTAAFNPEFWLDALKAIESSEVTIEMAGPDKPAVIRQPGFTYLVLPMKVS
jgi:DNA polymerase-3 subunit beta